MFKQDERLYYIDLEDGTVLEGVFIEKNTDGIWIRIKGHALNTYVYSDTIHERVYKSRSDAETGLIALRNRIKSKLLEKDSFIDDILRRLRKQEGLFYVSILEEILREKLSGHPETPSEK